MNPKDILMNELEEIAKEDNSIKLNMKDIRTSLSTFYQSIESIDNIRDLKVFKYNKTNTELEFIHEIINCLFDLARITESQNEIIKILLKDRE